jgi:predicted nucleic acid-binding protein
MSAGIVDASVATRWFLGEQADALVQSAMGLLAEYQAGRFNIHAPELLPIEVANAVWKQVRFAGLLPADARDAIAELLSYEMVLHPHVPLASESLDVALAHRISVYDATYVTVAKRTGLPLWTLDRRLARAVSGAIDVRIPTV